MASVQITHIEESTVTIAAGKRASVLAYDTTKDQMSYYKADGTTLRHLMTLDDTNTPLHNLGNLTLDDGKWIGLGAGQGRISFDDTTVDVLAVEDARLAIGATTAANLLHIYESNVAAAITTADHSQIIIENAGAGGDVGVQFELTGGQKYSFGIDNSQAGDPLVVYDLTATRELINIQDSAIEFNSGEADVDFIINADSVANALVVDGATGHIGVSMAADATAVLAVSGAIYTSDKIGEDATTYVDFSDTNALQFYCDSKKMFLLDPDAVQENIVFNPTGLDLDFFVMSDTTTGIHLDAALTTVGIGKAADSADKLAVDGDVQINNYIRQSGDRTHSYFGFDGSHVFKLYQDEDYIMESVSNVVTFNPSGVDIDFIVESNNNANMLTVNGGGDRVGIGKDPSQGVLDVNGDAYATGLWTAQKIGHTDDADTYYSFNGIDQAQLYIGGTEMYEMVASSIRFNNDAADMDLFHKGTSGNYIFYSDASVSFLGIRTQSPNSILDIAGSMSIANTAKTANYTLTSLDCFVECDASGGAFTITLPAVSGLAGRVYHIKKTDNNATVTIDGSGSETIDGATTLSLLSQYQHVSIICDGTEWWIIAQGGGAA